MRNKVLSKISEIEWNIHKEIADLHLKVEKCEIRSIDNSFRIERYAAQSLSNSKDIELLEKKFTSELSRYNVKIEERIPYIFTAPPRNRYFTGRNDEIENLKRILKLDKTSEEKKVRVAAVCGLGGNGKTSLVSEYAHQMKDFYKGGVYWFSGEDDARLHNTVNAVAVRIGALLSSFEVTLPNLLKRINTSDDPCLIVLDCLDQLDLSPHMMEFLSFPSQESIYGHFLVLSRRNPKRLVNEVSCIQEDYCLPLECFQPEEAKQFLFSRTGVSRNENNDETAECLCTELGELPLALEQAGAYIQMRRCTFSMYLEQYKSERLRLLNRKLARPVGNDSPQRLAVHTTWLINIEYMKESVDGQVAVRFMNACSFFNGNEIQEELINVGMPRVEEISFRQCVSSPLGCREVLNLLTDFSLFRYVNAHSVSTNRLVQELVMASLDPESKAKSFLDAVRMLSYAFSKCSSPNDHVSLDESFSDLPDTPSHFYMWSKFCGHGHLLCRGMEELLVTLDPVCLDSVWLPETAKILYECAVHLSARHKHEEARRNLNLAYRVLDWIPAADCDELSNNLENNSIFPIPIPLSKPFQYAIQRSSMPPLVSFKFQSNKSTHHPKEVARKSNAQVSEAGDPVLNTKIEKLRCDGNISFNEGRYPEALVRYSSALASAQKSNADFNPLLFINRATVYLKLGKYEDALKDANEYISHNPDCWRGYAIKALALARLNDKVSAEIAASLAFYHNRTIFLDFKPFGEFFGAALEERIFICNSEEELCKAIFSKSVEAGVLKILVLGSEEYVLEARTVVEPWDNCILVGTRNYSLVTIRSGCFIHLLKCMLTNLSLHLNKAQVCCLSGSFVKILNCNFISNGNCPAVVTFGEFNAHNSNFTSKQSSGLCVESGNAVVDGCSFHENGDVGLQVRKDGTLFVKSSHVYGNGQHGLIIGPAALKCVVINCNVHHNAQSGIVIMNSKNVRVLRNNVFDNYDNGIRGKDSDINVRENKVFDNSLWGIWSARNTCLNLSMNSVFHNKAGGVRLEHSVTDKDFPPSVMKLNKIYDNAGPGFVEYVNKHRVDRNSSSIYRTATRDDNTIYNNRENEDISKLNCSVPYCSNCREECELRWCSGCFTATYCKQLCHDSHLSKHKKLCKVLREKSSYLISSMTKANENDIRVIEGRKQLGPEFSPPPPRDGESRFVVKVHPAIRQELNFLDILYDRSLELCMKFESRVIDEFLEELGVQCERNCVEKKLFFYCQFETNGQLRLFTNEFPEFQDW